MLLVLGPALFAEHLPVTHAQLLDRHPLQPFEGHQYCFLHSSCLSCSLGLYTTPCTLLRGGEASLRPPKIHGKADEWTCIHRRAEGSMSATVTTAQGEHQ